MTGIWLISYIALWLLFLGVSIVLLSVLRNLGIIYESMSSSPTTRKQSTNLIAGQVLPELTLRTLAGYSKATAEFCGRKIAFIIISPTCSPCKDLLERIAQGNIQVDPLDSTLQDTVLVSVGDATMTANLVQQLGLSQKNLILLDTERLVLKIWGISATPTTVIVDAAGKVVRQIFGT